MSHTKRAIELNMVLIVDSRNIVGYAIQQHVVKACHARVISQAKNEEEALGTIDIHGKNISLMIISVDSKVNGVWLAGWADKQYSGMVIVFTGPSSISNPPKVDGSVFLSHKELKAGALHETIVKLRDAKKTREPKARL